MRFLITGDIHANNYSQFSYTRKNGMNSRLYNCLKVFDLILKEAKERDIRKAIINGDTFQEGHYIDTEVFDSVYLRLERLHDEGLEVIINLGQHDVARLSGRRILHALRAFRKVAQIVEKPTLVWDTVQVVPWDSPESKLKATINSLAPSKQKCLVLHCGIQGARTGANRFLVRNAIRLRDINYKKYGLVLLSDYHTRQKLARNVWYIGSPLQHSFNEVHRPCIWEVSLDRRGIFETHKIYTNFPQFRRIQADNRSELFEACKEYKAGDYVRVTAGDKLTERDVQRAAGRFDIQIQAYSDDREPSEASASSKDFNIVKAIQRYVRRQVKSDSSRKRLLQLGEKLYQGETV